ncbi:hypothetical protein DW953_02190 [Ruminococcus sp. AM45-2]|nr:hypothetical protein DW953_02190 [Ruminococcus sp. AM45-2]
MISYKKSRKSFWFKDNIKNLKEDCRKSKICVIIHSIKMKKNITEYLQNDKSLIIYRYVILLYYVKRELIFG